MIRQYMQRLQRILGDQRFARFNPYDLLDYVNEARGWVANEGECVRVLVPSTAGVASFAVTAGGSGYTSIPSVTLTGPNVNVGRTGTAVAAIAAGRVVAVGVNDPGTGYTSPPSVSFSGGGGTGAAATATLLPFAQVITGQEVYNFADFNDLVRSTGTGADQIIDIRNVALSWGSMKPACDYLDWGDFQAYLRAYNVGAQSFPRVWSIYQRGSTGSLYFWPVPSQNAQIDLDCICLPQELDLNSDAGAEPIPYPYTLAVPYKAASLAVLGEPDVRDLSDRYEAHYMRRMVFASAVTQGPKVSRYYSAGAML